MIALPKTQTEELIDLYQQALTSLIEFENPEIACLDISSPAYIQIRLRMCYRVIHPETTQAQSMSPEDLASYYDKVITANTSKSRRRALDGFLSG